MTAKHPSNIGVIAHYTGKIILGEAVIMLIPLLAAAIAAEWNGFLYFAVGIGACTLAASLLLYLTPECGVQVDWMQGMVTAALSWLVCMVLGGIPFLLSGHWLSLLDSSFDVMSGMTTTGLTLVQDLEHLEHSVNLWRHLLSFVGGQGMIVMALTFLIKGSLVPLYVGEGKDEKLMPRLVDTAKAIWFISLGYLVPGTIALWVAMMFDGIGPARAFFHAITIYFGAWSTGGFAPQSQNVLYYHSISVEAISFVVMVIGSLNFALHYAVWTGNRKEIYKNIEAISFAATSTFLFVLATLELSKLGVYPNLMSIMRKGYYNLISGHTTTGFSTIYARQFPLEWGPLAMVAMTAAMLFGGSACSTAGGFKGLRIGILVKGLMEDVRKLTLPSSAVVITKFHHVRDVVLEDRHVRNAALIVLSYLGIWMVGTLVGTYYGFPVMESMFESASASGNVGLSSGVLSASAPNMLKATYLFLMWAGRLEFMSIYALVAIVLQRGLKRR